MKKFLLMLGLFVSFLELNGQVLKTNNKMLDKAFALALKTIDNNTEDSLLKAGGGYSSEWTRDIAINCWNCTSLFRPDISRHSLWSVTQNNRQQVGHQHWDKIIWVTAALNHYYVTGDVKFLGQAYVTSKNTMSELESSSFDKVYGLFVGPAVFQDGISGYDEPIADKTKYSSYILDYPAALKLKCLSTNCIYYSAYNALAKMSDLVGDCKSKQFLQKGKELKANIRKYLYDSEADKLYYLIDHNGKVHMYQEGLGIAFSYLTNILDSKEMNKVIKNVYVSDWGLPCVWPIYSRFSVEKPGRHNNMIWPFVNAFFAEAALKSGYNDKFYFELYNLAKLAIVKGPNNFQEIYNMTSGEPDGGWQVGGHWGLKQDQTWSATGYIRMITLGLFGLEFNDNGVFVNPVGMKDGSKITLSDVKYRDAVVNLTVVGAGKKIKKCTINGVIAKPFIAANSVGVKNVIIELY